MFTISVETLDRTVLTAIAELFIKLANGGQAPEEMSARQYINKLDAPDVGQDMSVGHVGGGVTAMQVFGGAGSSAHGTVKVEEGQSYTVTVGERDAASIFAASPNGLPQGLAPSAPAAPSTETSSSTPLAPPPVAPSLGANVLLDSSGLPWDARIHSGSRTQTGKAIWKAKKNVDPALVTQVIAELRSAMNAPAAPFVPLNVAQPPIAEAPPPPNVVPPAVAPAPPSIIVQQQAASDAPTFIEVMQYVTDKKIAAEQILAICNAHGLAGLALLHCRPDLNASMMAMFKAL